MLAFLRDKIELMRIEVTYIDDPEPKRRLKFHLPKRRTPRPAPPPPVEHVKPAKPAKATASAKPKPKPKLESKPKSSKPATQRRGLPRPVRNVLVSAMTLLVLLLGAGVAYTYFLGGGGALPTDAQNVAAKSYQPIQPTKPAPDAPVGVAVESLSTPVSPGSNAYMAVKTLPEATCKIAVIYGYIYDKKQQPASDPSLGQRTADAYGTADWNWMVSPSAALGKTKATVTCTHNKYSGVVEGDIEVVAPGSATSAN